MAKRVRKKKPAQRSGGFLAGLFLVVLLFAVGTQLYAMQDRLAQARTQEAELTRRVEQLKEENEQLEEDLARGGEAEMIEEIAREELDMVVQNEKVFYYS